MTCKIENHHQGGIHAMTFCQHSHMPPQFCFATWEVRCQMFVKVGPGAPIYRALPDVFPWVSCDVSTL